MLEHVVIHLSERLCPHVPGRMDANWYWNFRDVTASVSEKPGFVLGCMKCGMKMKVPTDKVVSFVVIDDPADNVPVCQNEDEPEREVSAEKEPSAEPAREQVPFKPRWTPGDRAFLQSLKISTEGFEFEK